MRFHPMSTAAATLLEQLDNNNDMFFNIDIADFTHCDTFLADHILDNDEQLHFDKGQLVVGPRNTDCQVIEVVGDERAVIIDGW